MGDGPFLYTADGREIIDGLSGLWNVNVGHGRKELAGAAAKQMERLAYASAYIGATNEPAVRLAERLVHISYSNMSAVYFTTAGAESNESAFKFARYYWKVKGKPTKTKLVSRIHGYHGVTMAAMSATGMAAYHKMFGPLVPGFVQVPAPYPYRWSGNTEPGQRAADALEERIRAEGPDTVAAVIAEPVMGAGGVIVPPDTYWPALRRICDKHDVLLIADEVITGFGRTGRMFALDRWNVEPDLVSFAKGVTSASSWSLTRRAGRLPSGSARRSPGKRSRAAFCFAFGAAGAIPRSATRSAWPRRSRLQGRSRSDRRHGKGRDRRGPRLTGQSFPLARQAGNRLR